MRHLGRVGGISELDVLGPSMSWAGLGYIGLGWIVKFQLCMGCVRLGLVKLQLVRFFGDKKS